MTDAKHKVVSFLRGCDDRKIRYLSMDCSDEEHKDSSLLKDERPHYISDPDYLESFSEGAGSFMDPNLTYEFMLKGFSTVSSNGSGIVNTELPFDPSSSGYNFAEWTNFAALFSQVRIKSVTIVVLTTNWSGASAPVEIVALAGGINPTAQGVPGSVGTVISLADGRFINGQMSSEQGTTFTHHFTDIEWSPTSTVVVTPYSGCPGSFVLYGSVFPNTTQVALVRVGFVYQFRCRD